MYRAKENSVRPDRNKLDSGSKAQYLQQNVKIDTIDPYEHWSQNLNDLPLLSEAELVLYLVNGTRYNCTGDKFRNAKSLKGSWSNQL